MLNFLIPMLVASVISLVIVLTIDNDDLDDVNRIKTGLIISSYIVAIAAAMLLNLVALITAL
jgi:hypothetical protein